MVEMLLINKMEQIVKSCVDIKFASLTDCCTCDRCKLDVVALTLNSLPPKYAVTTIGDMVTEVILHSNQWQADVMMAMLRAIDIVTKKPRHS